MGEVRERERMKTERDTGRCDKKKKKVEGGR